jgi:Ni/Co efflux regulator RcnB
MRKLNNNKKLVIASIAIVALFAFAMSPILDASPALATDDGHGHHHHGHHHHHHHGHHHHHHHHHHGHHD